MTEPKSYATRDLILQASDLDFEDVFVPEWSSTVRVRELTGAERGSFEASVSKFTSSGGKTDVELDAQQLRVKLCALTIVDENGGRLFSDSDLEDLGKKSARALQRCFDVASRLSGISDDSVEDAAEKSEGRR